MKQHKNTVILIIVLGISLLTNVFFLVRASVIKSEYTWLRRTYEADTIETYESQGQLMARIEHLDGKHTEYVLDGASPTMGIAVEPFTSYKPSATGNADLLWRLQQIFNNSNQREPERAWQIDLKNKGLQAFVRDHNRATQSFLKTNKP